jgi:hypothetical protein
MNDNLQEETPKIALGELGTFNLVDEKEMDEVFDHLNGIVFKLKKCMFRVSFINKGKRTFSAILINEKPPVNS